MKDLSPSSASNQKSIDSTEQSCVKQAQPVDFGMMMRRPDDLEQTPNSYKERLEK